MRSEVNLLKNATMATDGQLCERTCKMVDTASPADDKYSEGIELSNACREYYHTRQRTAEEVKQRLTNCGQKTNKTSIDTAMDTLRKEMASLMDLDLSLMKQLLTMNDAIEDLKCQREFRNSYSSTASSLNIHDSDWSVSETDMLVTDEEDDDCFDLKSPISATCANNDDNNDITCSDVIISKNKRFTSTGTTSVCANKSVSSQELQTILNANKCYEEHDSFDSGVYESC